MTASFFRTINLLTDRFLAPFASLGPRSGLLLLGAGSAFVLLLLFKRLSNQARVKEHKDKIIGHFLEIALYRDQFRRSMVCQGQILRHNLLYLGYTLPPLLPILPLIVLLSLQIDYRLGYKPLAVGDTFIIQVTLDPQKSAITPETLAAVQLTPSPEIILETPALRDLAAASLFWRGKLIGNGPAPFIQVTDGKSGDLVTKTIAVARGGGFAPEKRKWLSLADALAGAETPIPPGSIFRAIRTTYQEAQYPWWHWRFSALTSYFLLTMAWGLLLKPLLKVNI